MSPWRAELFLYPASAEHRPLVGISACLLGEPVRYDGGHKLQPAFASHLAPWLQLEAICPEVGIGLGVPRPTLDGISTPKGVRIVFTENQALDVTDKLTAYADSYIQRCGRFWPLSAYIFKARSPSCGVGTLPVDRLTGGTKTTDGAFAGRFRQQLPWLCLYEEEHLEDQANCEDMLLLTYICRDILWQQPESSLPRLREHYQGVIDAPLSATDRLGLWLEVKVCLEENKQKRRQLVTQFRAVSEH